MNISELILPLLTLVTIFIVAVIILGIFLFKLITKDETEKINSETQKRLERQQINQKINENKQTQYQKQESKEEILPYHSKYLLTKNEWNFYQKLKPIADQNQIHIIAKVRLADLVEVDSYLTGNGFNKYFWKIQAKHVDFVLCNPSNLAVIAVLELDDSSHNSSAERAERDDFVDKVLTKCGYKIIHTYNGTNIEDVLRRYYIIK